MQLARTRLRYGVETSAQWAHDLRLAILHIGALGVFFVPFNWSLVGLTFLTLFPRVFGMTAGYHRYFSHRAFKTTRAFQFFLALLASSTGQRGILWWAAHHRNHHRHSDHEGDAHSPQVHGFWGGHIGWLLKAENGTTDLDRVADFSRFPELRWLNRYYYVPVYGLMLTLYSAGAFGWLGPEISGWQAVFWGFFLSTVLVLHLTLFVNSLCHAGGRFGGTRRYATSDASVNLAWLAIPSLGEAWHNNHHRYGAAARAGFAWWELDLTYLILRLLSVLWLVRDLRPVPAEILEEGRLIRRACTGQSESESKLGRRRSLSPWTSGDP